jgi:hypothetical protein
MGMPNSSIMQELYNIPNEPPVEVEEEIYIEDED